MWVPYPTMPACRCVLAAVADGAACAAPALTAEPTLGMAGMAGITLRP